MIRRISVNEITTFSTSIAPTVTGTNLQFAPTGAGDESSAVVYNTNVDFAKTPPVLSFSYDAQFEYAYTNQGVTFMDFCNCKNQSGSVALPDGSTVCAGTPSVTASATSNPASITTTSTSVSGVVTLSFSVDNLCSPTIICVEDTTCVI